MSTTYAITPLIVGACESPEARLLYLGDPEKTIPTNFTFFLLKGDDKTILVDVGFTAEYGKQYMPDVKQEKCQDPVTQLKAHGVEPEDVDEIIITHAHFDHLSDVVNEYKNARIHIQRKEVEFVTNPPHPWFQEMVDMELVRQLAEKGAPRFNLIEGECELFPGIRTVMTPGHTAGHQSVLVETESGTRCITGDAVLNYRNLEEDVGVGFNCSLIDSLQSLKKLRELTEEGVIMLPGHDPKMLLKQPME